MNNRKKKLKHFYGDKQYTLCIHLKKGRKKTLKQIFLNKINSNNVVKIWFEKLVWWYVVHKLAKPKGEYLGEYFHEWYWYQIN